MAWNFLYPYATNERTVVQTHIRVIPKDAKVLLTKDQLAKIFRRYDTNNDGQLSVDELMAAFEYLGSRCCSFRAFWGRINADINRDHKINLTNDELTELVRYAHSCGYKVKACEITNTY